MRNDLPTGTVTFLFTDVEGSTQLLEQIGDEAYDGALAEHRRVVRAACAATGGVEVDTQGDAFFFAFPTAPGALAAASEMTRALASGPIHLRIGLHTGEPRLSDEGYVGKEVHFAARVAASGHGGQIILSKATAELVDGSLTDLGEHRLKDIADAVPIYQLGEENFPPLKTISNTNLPRPASSFLGREQELAALLANVDAGARLVTLTGPGGTGKTRLALEAAFFLVSEYKAGVFWVGLASLRDPAFVTETIAQTLGAKDGLASHIGERELLLLLDNLEQVIEAAPELSALLQTCPNLTMLVTSRELLRVSGEVEYAVPPLAESEAVFLFCERSQLEPSEEIASICARLDSLPLAVELAAARTKALSPAQILERLSGRLDLLKGGRDADPRQQTLRATIEWSNDLLTPAEQRLFARLSVFAGGCTLEAAEEVCDADLDTLQSLVEKSLLRFSNERYWMLETIREYANARLIECGDADQLARRHAEHFLALAESVETDLLGKGQGAALNRLELEHDNLRTALAWSLGGEDVSVALRLAVALWRFWNVHGHFAECLSWLQRAISAAESAPGASPVLLARAYDCAARMSGHLGRLENARFYAETSVELYRGHGGPADVARSLGGLGLVLQVAGDYDAAAVHMEEAVELAREAESPHHEASVSTNLGYLELLRGELARAEPHLQRGVELYGALGNDEGVALALQNLGFVAVARRRFADAEELLFKSLAAGRAVGSTEVVLYCFVGLASVAAARGETEKAARLLGAAQVMQEGLGIELQEFEQELHETTASIAAAALTNEEFKHLFGLGRAMTSDDVIALIGSTENSVITRD